MWSHLAANLQNSGLAVAFFGAADKSVLPLSLGLGQDRCHKHRGDSRSRTGAQHVQLQPHLAVAEPVAGHLPLIATNVRS